MDIVLTTLEQLESYDSLHALFRQARTALEAAAKEPFQSGRRPVDGENIYLVGLEYDTKPAEKTVYEAHRRYIDIMLLLSGEEAIGSAPLTRIGEIFQPYDGKGDALLAKSGTACSMVHMRPGDVAVYFPEDAHAPGLAVNGAQKVRKLIAKVCVAAQEGR